MLTLPYPPSVNHYLRRTSRGVFLTDEARAYKEYAMLLARAAGLERLQGAVGVEVHFYRPSRRGDIDAGLKLVLDSLNGIAYEDDKQIVELHVYRHDDKDNPRVEVSLWPL